MSIADNLLNLQFISSKPNQMQDGQDFRRNREKYVMEIRKNNREDIITKNRKKIADKSENSDRKIPPIIIDDRFSNFILQFVEAKYSLNQLRQHCQNLQKEDIILMHESIIAIRKIVSQEELKETIQKVVDSGVIPLLINMMKQTNYPQIQLEACWIITNIASGSNAQCESIVQKGCIEVLLQLLYENKPYIVEQALWGIGNIAGDCPKFRDQILAKGGHERLMKIIQNSQKISVIRQGAWALSNLCRGAPLPKYQTVKPIIPILCKTIANDLLVGEQLSDALWAVVNNSQGQKSRVQRVLQVQNFPPKLISLCYLGQIQLMIPCLRILGNISTGNERQTDVILKIGGLKLIQTLLEHPKKSVRREVCWILSNICAGTKNQIAQIINYPYLLYKVALLFTSDDYDIKKEICYVFGNMCHLGQVNAVFHVLVELRVLQNYINLIYQNSDIKMLEPTLLTLYDILSLGQRACQPNPFLKIMQSIPGCFQQLESLQHHQSNQIYKLVIKIFQRFFSLQDNNIL